MNDAVAPVDLAPVDLAAGKAALQSSYSPFSQPNDPLAAISGRNTGCFSFHTEHETAPWWLVDLGEVAHVASITVFNRGDGAQQRARFLTIEIFDPARGGWRSIYQAENEFGDVHHGAPLSLNFGSRPLAARYIKLALRATDYLHLDGIEIRGHRPGESYKAGIIARQGPAPYLDRHRPLADQPRERGAIVALVRGYERLEDYAALIARNAAIHATLNAQVERQYPLLLWHEGNILPEHQQHIRSHEKNADVRFIDISERFTLPPGVDLATLREGWPLGYRLMCKFNTWDIWELTAGFDTILRIDEDCVLAQLDGDPFEWLARHDLDCGFSLLVDDNHDLSNETLPPFLEAYAAVHGLDWARPRPLTSGFPYTNVMLASTTFFRNEAVAEFLRAVVLEPDFYRNRWGDHIVLGVPLALHSSAARIQPIPGLVYDHHSHAMRIRANDDHRRQATPAGGWIDPDGTPEERERAILRAFKDWPLDRALRARVKTVSEEMGRDQVADRL